MELYTKESLKEVIEKSKDEFYMPKALFDHYKNLRLETKLAYVSVLETMKNKAVYTTENLAYVKDVNKTASQLGPILGIDVNELISKLHVPFANIVLSKSSPKISFLYFSSHSVQV